MAGYRGEVGGGHGRGSEGGDEQKLVVFSGTMIACSERGGNWSGGLGPPFFRIPERTFPNRGCIERRSTNCGCYSNHWRMTPAGTGLRQRDVYLCYLCDLLFECRAGLRN